MLMTAQPDRIGAKLYERSIKLGETLILPYLQTSNFIELVHN